MTKPPLRAYCEEEATDSSRIAQHHDVTRHEFRGEPMHEIALYHPRIHFPSDSWVKTAALYWTKIARIIPKGYQPRDSRSIKELSDKLGFVVKITRPPGTTVYTRSFGPLCRFIYENREVLRTRYGIDQQDHPATWRLRDRRPISEAHTDLRIAPYMGVIHGTKIKEPYSVTSVLLDHGLATKESGYILMHPALARVCMSILAEDIAHRNRMQPVTDDDADYAMTIGWKSDGWTEARIHSVLLPDLPNSEEQREKQREEADRNFYLPLPIGLLAVQVIVPKGVDRIPVKKIIALREQYATYFSSFRDAADAVAAEIKAQLTNVEDVDVIRAYIEQEVQERLVAPTRQLRRELQQMKVDTVTATLTSKYEMPALVGLVSAGVLAHEPLIAGGSAVALALLGRLRGRRDEIQQRLAQSPVSYLMLMEDSLTASTGLKRTVQQIRKITGSP